MEGRSAGRQHCGLERPRTTGLHQGLLPCWLPTCLPAGPI